MGKINLVFERQKQNTALAANLGQFSKEEIHIFNSQKVLNNNQN